MICQTRGLATLRTALPWCLGANSHKIQTITLTGRDNEAPHRHVTQDQEGHNMAPTTFT